MQGGSYVLKASFMAEGLAFSFDNTEYFTAHFNSAFAIEGLLLCWP